MVHRPSDALRRAALVLGVGLMIWTVYVAGMAGGDQCLVLARYLGQRLGFGGV